MTCLILLVGLLSFHAVHGNFLSRAVSASLRQTFKEMELEDRNSVSKIDDRLERRLIVMPLSNEFNPSQASEMHNKIQHGDKCSIPGTLGRLIFEKPYEVPWLFEIIPVRRMGYVRTAKSLLPPGLNMRRTIDVAATPLDKAYLSPLDFRSPESYIFLPTWLMEVWHGL